MVGGRRGGYRDHETRDRESDIGKVSRRRESYESRVENGRDLDHGRSQARYAERQKDRDGRDRVKSRRRDVREREVANGGRPFAPRNGEGSGNGHAKERAISVMERAISVMDRELGELSSGSGSDELSDSLATANNKTVENGRHPVEEKKRKFSPIVWDIDEKQVAVKLKNKSTLREDSHTRALPSSPAHLTLHQSTQVNLVEANLLSSETSSHAILEMVQSDIAVTSETSSHAILEMVQSDIAVAVETTDSPASKSPVMAPGLAPQVPEHGVEEEDYVPTRNISASRWADEGVSPRDEGEIIDEGVINKSRKKISGSVETLNAGRISPESGEFTRDGSQEALSRSSGSGRQGATSRSASDDDCPGGELDRNDYMDVDGDDDERNSMTESDDEKSNSSDDLVVPLQRSINMLEACRSVDEFEKLNKIDEGTYGVVFRARDTKNGEVVALKKVKMEKEKEGFPLTSLREINILLSFHHPSVVDVKEVVVGSKLDDIFMVMEYMEHDLKALMETMKQPFSQSEVKCLMIQLLEGVNYLHDNWVLHRDLKASNLLLNNRGELKICDFGLARQYGSPLKPYTQLVVTLWYRAPELLLGAKEYSTAIDMWSIGCIMAEMLAKEPLFSGKNEIDQLSKIYKILGTPNEKIWPGFANLPGVKVNFAKNPYNKLREKFPPTSFSGRPTLSEAGFDLLNQFLTYDPKKRITAEAALNHGWFQEVPLPKSKEFMPTFPAQHAQDRRLRRVMKSPDPLQELRDKERRGELIGTGSLFG